jgi:hypothetical protein
MKTSHQLSRYPTGIANGRYGQTSSFVAPASNGREAPNSAVGLEAMRFDRSEFDGLLTSFPLNGDL